MLATDKTESLGKKATIGDLANYGLESVAYIKPVMLDGHKLHAIHAADGTPLTVVEDRSIAFATVLQHNLEAASVH